MNKEIRNVLICIITLVINVLAPILIIDMYKDYTAKSFIVGAPDKVVKIENLDIKDYVFQENLSQMNFATTENENEYIFNYYFNTVDFNSTANNYLIYINDYMLSITSLESKAISGRHTRFFRDSKGQICNEVDIEVTFEFYSTYSYLLVKLTTPDMSYLNGFRENPGLVLTLSKVNYGMLGNLDNYKEVVTLQQQLSELQNKYNELQSQHSILQNQYNQSSSSNVELTSQITELNRQIIDLQERLDAYNKENKYEIAFESKGVTQEVVLLEMGSKLTTEQIPTLSHTDISHFAGWSLDGTTIIDPATVDITANTTFKAVWRDINGTWAINPECITEDNSWITELDKNIVISNDTLTATCNGGYEFNVGTYKYNDYAYYGQLSTKECITYIYSAELDVIVMDYLGAMDIELEDSITPNRPYGMWIATRVV